MSWYARGPRLVRQVALDALVVLWGLLWFGAGQLVRRAVNASGAPARKTAEVTQAMVDDLDTIQRILARIPAVGDDFGVPFRALMERLRQVVQHNTEQATQVGWMADIAGLLTFLIPTLVLVAVWLPGRWRFASEAASATPHLDDAADLDLYALRAMANVPLAELAKVSSDPAAAWRAGDTEVIRRLAALELSRVGLKAPKLLDVAARPSQAKPLTPKGKPDTDLAAEPDDTPNPANTSTAANTSTPDDVPDQEQPGGAADPDQAIRR